MSLEVVIYLSLVLAGIGLLVATFVFLVWALLGQRGALRVRRLRISLSSFALFAAALFSAVSAHYCNLMPASMRMLRPDFQPPYHSWSKTLSILAPMFILLSAGLAVGAVWRNRETRKLILLTALSCFLLALAIGAANYRLIYSVQVPAFDRYAMIESRDWFTHVGEAAPDFSVTMLDNSQLHLSDLHGKVVLVNFFATWCGPCMNELPHLEELWNDWSDNGDFTMLIVGREESQEPVAKFRSENGYTFPMAVDPDRSAFSKFAPDGIPRTYLISRDGIILYQSLGFAEIDLYARELSRLRQIIDSECRDPAMDAPR